MKQNQGKAAGKAHGEKNMWAEMREKEKKKINSFLYSFSFIDNITVLHRRTNSGLCTAPVTLPNRNHLNL